MRRLALALTVGLVIAGNLPWTDARVSAACCGHVKIRIYNYAHVPEGTLDPATVDAARIFEKSGVAVDWEVCRVRESAEVSDDPACGGPVEANEFTLRIVAEESTRHAADRGVPEVLGYSVISPDHLGIMATVLFRRVGNLAERSGNDTSSLLGRVMAHEVGHLLLGSNGHAPIGLMRAVWKLNPTALRDDSEWSFSREEAARLRQRAARQSTN